MPAKPEFKSMNPFKVPTDAVDNYAKQRNIPSTVFPQSSAAARTEKPASNIVKLSLEVPEYVVDRLKRKALDERRTHRALVLHALAKYGIEIAPEDLVDDGRKKGKAQRT
jgi:hypothetical protein